jgi:hypothetical protein
MRLVSARWLGVGRVGEFYKEYKRRFPKRGCLILLGSILIACGVSFDWSEILQSVVAISAFALYGVAAIYDAVRSRSK